MKALNTAALVIIFAILAFNGYARWVRVQVYVTPPIPVKGTLYYTGEPKDDPNMPSLM